MAYKRSRILSVGAALPETMMTNKDLERFVDTSHEWIVKRTGIHTRYITPKGSSAPAAELGAKAAERALEMANLKVNDIDCIVCATFTPDNFFPSTACDIARRIGCLHVPAFDLSAACSGFVYAITVANAMITSDGFRTILVVGTEVISRALNWNDRNTCILFGDGAGAVVLQGTDAVDEGILASTVGSDSSLGDILKLPAWDGRQNISMNGSEVFKHAVSLMTESTNKCLKKCLMSNQDIDLFIPHQANLRIMKAVARNLSIPTNKIASTVELYGNTSSASIPLALRQVWQDGKIDKGTVVVFVALGGGITWGSAIVRF
jgi:3-oxoacyl-[acyl-carrier-protein] synthase-3